MTRKLLLLILTKALLLIIFSHAILFHQAQAKTGERANLAFLLTNSPYADTLLHFFAQNLKAGDYLLLVGGPRQVPWLVQIKQQAKNLMPAGVNIFTMVIFVNIDTLEATVPTLSKEIEWVVYDYEGGPNFSPEFTRDQQASIGFFDRGLAVSRQNGFKFMVTPPYGQVRNANWNWGEVAKHMDGICVQFQALLKNPEILVPEVTQVVRQIDSLSPNTLTIIQFSLVPTRGTVDGNLLAITQLQNEPIDAFLLFYGPTQIDTLQEFFDKFNITAIDNPVGVTPNQFVLWQNYPNPFNPTTTIRFSIPKTEFVTLKVFDVLGNEVATLVNDELNPGEHSVVFDAKNVPSGVYFYQLKLRNFVQQKKMEVVK